MKTHILRNLSILTLTLSFPALCQAEWSNQAYQGMDQAHKQSVTTAIADPLDTSLQFPEAWDVNPALPSEATDKDKSWTTQPVEGESEIQITVGNSHVIRFTRMINRIALSELQDPNAQVAEVAVLSANEVLINTKNVGSANLLVWDMNQNIFMYRLVVIRDPAPLRLALEKISPDANLDVFANADEGFIVKGEVGTVEQQDKISEAAKAFSERSISLVSVKDPKQILLEVRFLEVSRGTGMEFGIDWGLFARNFSAVYLPGATDAVAIPDEGVLNFGLPDEGTDNLFTSTIRGGPNSTITNAVRALEEKNLVKVIARPNLLVRDGEEASFLTGGEFPIPVVTQNTQAVSCKEFVPKLIYTPKLLEDDRIQLELQTEVSQLDAANGVTSNGFVIPALTSRKTTTVVNLNNDQTFIISGLIQQRKTEIENGVPFLRKIPWFGRMFENTDNSYSEVELIVMITPHLLDPEKEAIDLNNIDPNHPLHAALKQQNPPFENDRALAIETALLRYEIDKLEQSSDLNAEEFNPDAFIRPAAEGGKTDAAADAPYEETSYKNAEIPMASEETGIERPMDFYNFEDPALAESTYDTENSAYGAESAAEGFPPARAAVVAPANIPAVPQDAARDLRVEDNYDSGFFGSVANDIEGKLNALDAQIL